MTRLPYDDFYKLRTNPFGETPDPRFYFASKTHRNALRSLNDAIEQGKGFSLLTGEVGTGKTLISRILLEQVSRKADSALILYPNCNEQELIHSIMKEFEIAPGPTSLIGHQPDLDRLNDFLLDNCKKSRKTVLLIDETQNMPGKTLETLRLLSNFETTNQKLIHMVLCAQPEFLKRLESNDFRQLHQRIGTSLKLEGLGIQETELYIKHRIECAGGANFLRFDSEACKLIQKATSGVPRRINHLCDQTLQLAKLRQTRLITKEITREVLPEASNRSWFANLFIHTSRREGPLA